MNLEEKELQLLRDAVDDGEKTRALKQSSSDAVKKLINLIEYFLKTNDLICYGGTAINNLLPKKYKFYNNYDIPDYDCFSPNAIEDVKKLADYFKEKGYIEIEAKAGVHLGTYKLYVQFIPVADITQMSESLFNTLLKKSVKKNGIRYAPPNFLKMSMYMELSRPDGDLSRWEKVLKRLVLLNKAYPIKHNCKKSLLNETHSYNKASKIFLKIKEVLIKHGVVFFGGYAYSFYEQYLPQKERYNNINLLEFDVLALDSHNIVLNIQKVLNTMGVTEVSIEKKEAVDEIVPTHYIVYILDNPVVFIYNTFSCHSYNIVKQNGKDIKIASIDTMLSLYLAFTFTNNEHYDENRILCLVHQLFMIQQKNRLKKKGILKRFSLDCYGKQETLTQFRENKAELFLKLKKQKNSTEYEKWFLKYQPGLSIKKKQLGLSSSLSKNVTAKRKSSVNKSSGKLKSKKK